MAFGVTLKIRKKSNFDRKQLKLSMQNKNMYMYQKKIKTLVNSLLAIFDEIWLMTVYYSTVYFVQILSNFKNS